MSLPIIDPLLNTMFPSASIISPHSRPLCGRQMKLKYDSFGEIEFCHHPVKVRVCRGTNGNPITAGNNKGFSYEACTQRLPEGSHFHRWRRDIPRKINTVETKNPFIDILATQGCTLQSLLDVQVTPQHCPSISATPRTLAASSVSPTHRSYTTTPTRPRKVLQKPLVPSPFLTPARRNATNTPKFSPLGAHTESTSDHAAAPVLRPQAHLAAPNFDHPSVDSNTPSTPDTRSHTRTVIHKKSGKAVTVCNGPICRLNSAKDPVRNCTGCTHEFCKKCCLRFQMDGASQCAQDRHKLSPTDQENMMQTPTDTPVSTGDNAHIPVALDKYDRNRPFSAAHYSAKDSKQRQVLLKTDELLRKQVAQESLKRSIEIIFWKVSSNT